MATLIDEHIGALDALGRLLPLQALEAVHFVPFQIMDPGGSGPSGPSGHQAVIRRELEIVVSGVNGTRLEPRYISIDKVPKSQKPAFCRHKSRHARFWVSIWVTEQLEIDAEVVTGSNRGCRASFQPVHPWSESGNRVPSRPEPASCGRAENRRRKNNRGA
jgi:hypothetical protein